MSEKYVATGPIFSGRARVANAGDSIPATHPRLDEWLDAELVERAPEPEPDAPFVTLDDLTVPELRATAEARGVDLEGATKKDEILERLKS